MSESNYAELFIRLLGEALAADRLTQRAKRATRTNICAGRFKQLFRPDLAATAYSPGAMQSDYRCVSDEPQDLWFE